MVHLWPYPPDVTRTRIKVIAKRTTMPAHSNPKAIELPIGLTGCATPQFGQYRALRLIGKPHPIQRVPIGLNPQYGVGLDG